MTDKTAEIREKILESIDWKYVEESMDKISFDTYKRHFSEKIDMALSEGMKLGREEYIDEQLKNPTIFGQAMKTYEDYIRNKERKELIGEIEKFLKDRWLWWQNWINDAGASDYEANQRGHFVQEEIEKIKKELLKKIKGEEK